MQSTVYWVKETVTNSALVEEGADPKREYKQTLSFKGQWKDGKKSGYGVQTWQSGCKYEGNWSNDKRNGDGVLWTLKSGKMFKQYSGNWLNDQKHGMGVYYLKDGGRYEGEWKADKRDGHGSFFFADGSVYVGEWSDDNMSGFGSLTKANGDIYEGEWLNGKREGAGIYFFKAREKIYDGEWVDDVAKCGVYMDAADFFVAASGGMKRASSARSLTSTAQRMQSDLPLDKQQHRRHGARIPELRLAEPEQLLEQEIRAWQLRRQAARNLPFLVPEMLFAPEALAEMRRTFSAACKPAASASIEAATVTASELSELMGALSASLRPTDDEAAQLLADLGKHVGATLSPSSTLSSSQSLPLPLTASQPLPSAQASRPPAALSSSHATLSFSDFVKAVFRLNQLREAAELGDADPVSFDSDVLAVGATSRSDPVGTQTAEPETVPTSLSELSLLSPSESSKRNVRFE